MLHAYFYMPVSPALKCTKMSCIFQEVPHMGRGPQFEDGTTILVRGNIAEDCDRYKCLILLNSVKDK